MHIMVVAIGLVFLTPPTSIHALILYHGIIVLGYRYMHDFVPSQSPLEQPH